MLNSILLLIAGFGVFIFGTKMLSEKLEILGGNKMRKKLNQFSSNRFKAAGFGFLLTTVFQSSTASIVMIASFTSLGMLTLFQSVSMLIGANFASAIPGYLISFQTFGITNFFCALAGVGALIFVFTKKTWLKNLSQVLIAFGLMFVGLFLMKDSMSFLLEDPSFISFFSKITNPVLLILIGTAFTMLVQSSLGTIAIVISLVGTASVAGVIPVSSAAYIVYGANLGTAITTAFVICISSNLNGKRAAIFHVVYAVLGCIIFSLIGLTPWIDACFGWITEPAFQLVTANLVFNVVVGILLIPFVKYITILLCKIIKPLKLRHKKKNPLDVFEFTDESTAVAIAKATKKVFIFYGEIFSIYKLTTDYIVSGENTNFKQISRRQQNFGTYLNKLTNCVAGISFENQQYAKDVEKLLEITKQIDRINRNCEKILELLSNEKKIVFSAKLNRFLTKIVSNTNEMFEICKNYVLDPDCEFLKASLEEYEKIIKFSKANSEEKITAKSYVIENAAKSKAGNEKNTLYIEIISYLNMISNNLSDIVFDLVSENPNLKQETFEQLTLEDIN